ncbi:hypothetical protein GGI25_001620 [Coemansia spiralis]|uniref:Uncharacterized protein n=2 Tax=Coemansia TaxID=4863 RepID=A0A9W8KZU9_9FUNG|nr:hypothetical protein EDC05_003354 [Coemansia umbellata]KAJ2623949.1 hypothetical protein GGI26_001964 [Coemansia sp. RSA 1358]KAJ2679264.1 hypothetical protein GGI25_001620 [Coemansia spiralis]
MAPIAESLNLKLERAQAEAGEATNRAEEVKQRLHEQLEVLSENTDAQLSAFGEAANLPPPIITQNDSVELETPNQEESRDTADRCSEEDQQQNISCDLRASHAKLVTAAQLIYAQYSLEILEPKLDKIRSNIDLI